VLQGADPAAVDFIILSAALGLLPKLSCMRDEKRRLWMPLARRFAEPDMLSTAGARALSNALWATAKLADGRMLEASSAEVAAFVGAIVSELQREGNLGGADPQNLSNTLWALATLGRTGDGAFVSALLEAARSQLGSFNPQDLANTLWALATLGRTGDGAFVSALLEAARRQLGSFKPQALANTLWALATLGRTGDGAFVSALLERRVRSWAALSRRILPTRHGRWPSSRTLMDHCSPPSPTALCHSRIGWRRKNSPTRRTPSPRCVTRGPRRWWRRWWSAALHGWEISMSRYSPTCCGRWRRRMFGR
jgi:hypothetical protein